MKADWKAHTRGILRGRGFVSRLVETMEPTPRARASFPDSASPYLSPSGDGAGGRTWIPSTLTEFTNGKRKKASK